VSNNLLWLALIKIQLVDPRSNRFWSAFTDIYMFNLSIHLVLDFNIINEFYQRIRNALISLICDDLSCELSDSLATVLVITLIFTTLAAASLNLTYYSLMIS
jgi:hypothetical protein